MNNDLKATITGIIGGIVTVLASFNIVIPEMYVGVVVAITVGVLAYFTNKKDK